MFGRLLLLFIAIPILELCIFMYLGSKIGIPVTLAIIVLTAILGAYLTKSQGLKAYQKYQETLRAGKLPHEEVMDGLMILVAGALLLTPGFLTDAIGFSLLVPRARAVFRKFAKNFLKARVVVAGQAMGAPHARTDETRVITVDAEVVESSSEARRNPSEETR